ncbi:hypothetical protein JOQ06_018209, partial [Pogonophryne albipinna]
MYRNPWISNYLTHVKFCSQGLGSETPIKLSNPRLLQKRALSFQKEFTFDEKDDPAKSKDIDVSVLANLPKVSELRKRFEGITTSSSDWEMNSRKERIARRLEGIDAEVHPSLLPSLVVNRLLEEDTPRYTRASDPCEPCGVTVQRYSMEALESPELQPKAPERQSRALCRPDPPTSILPEPVHTSDSTTINPETESKVERIARYKAERRRQLAERYGISLDQEPDVEPPPRSTRTLKELEGSERRIRAESVGEEGRDITLSSYNSTSVTSPRAGRTAPQQSQPDPGYEVNRTRVDSLSERERLMNLENQRRAAPPELPSSSSYMDVTSMSSTATVPAKDSSVTGMPPNSPKASRHSSLSSPKHAVSTGDQFIEQPSHTILTRHGARAKPSTDWFFQTDAEGDTHSLINWPSRIRVRERIAREDRQRSPEPGNVTEAPVHRRHQTQTSTRSNTDPPQMYSHPHHQPRAQLARPGPPGGQEVGGNHSYLSMASGPTAGQDQQQLPQEEETEGLLRSRKAVLPSDIRRRERSTEDPRRGRWEEEIGMSRAQSLNQARKAEAEDPPRGRRRTRAETEHTSHLQASGSRHRERDNAVDIQKGVAATQIQPRAAHTDPGSPPSSCSMSDAGVSRGITLRNQQHRDPPEVREGDGSSNQEGHRDSRVSVAQLRHSYIENTTTPPTSRRNKLPSSEVEGDSALTGHGAPWRGERGRGRRPRQYIYPGESRKTSERSCVSSDLPPIEAEDEKLDERAKLSVAAKRSLFRELEKSIDGGAPKHRSRNAAVDRRLRRTQDRSRTQPVTTEEVVIAATVPTHVPHTVTVHTAVARVPSPTLVCSTVPPYSLQASMQQSNTAREQAREARQVQEMQEVQASKPVSTVEGTGQSQGQDEPDLCTLSLAEKMALFNRLSQPPIRVTRTRGDTRNRRANARYQTQPITLGDMEQEPSDIDSLDEQELSDGPVELLQLHNGTGSRLPTSSSSSALREGTVSTDHAGDIHITRAAVRVEPLPPSSDRSLPPHNPDAPSWRSQEVTDHQRYQNVPQREAGTDLGGGKRKLPSPEGVVRQAALPQPQRWGDVQSSESYMLQERQEEYLREEEHYPESRRSRAVSRDLPESAVTNVHQREGDVGEQQAQLWEEEQSYKKDDEELMMIDEFAVSDQLWDPLFASTFSPPPEPRFHTPSPDESASQTIRSPRPMQVDARHPWRRKRIADSETESQGSDAHMSIQERKLLIVAQEEAWKMKGHGAANDSTQFTVAARMVKKGLAAPSALQSLVTSKPKNSSLAISKPQEDMEEMSDYEEIKAVPDLNLETDLKLDKLESFLGKLNSKAFGLPESTITVTQKKVKAVMSLEDETFSKFYRQVEEVPANTNKVEIYDDFDAIFGPQVPKLASEMVRHRRAVRPTRNVQSSRNPLKMLAARQDIRHEYTEQRLNIGLLESKRMKTEKMNKNSGFSDVALAGLASKENFSSVNLRSVNISEQMSNNSAVPYKKLMLLQVK